MIDANKEQDGDIISNIYNGVNELIMVNRYRRNEFGVMELKESNGVNGHKPMDV